jgi:hypothetical protein
VLLVLDPTEYEKRSRERSKCERQMEHIGRVRRSKNTLPTQQSKGPTQTPEGRAPVGKDKRVATTPLTWARAQRIPAPLRRAWTTSLLALSTLPLPRG